MAKALEGRRDYAETARRERRVPVHAPLLMKIVAGYSIAFPVGESAPFRLGVRAALRPIAGGGITDGRARHHHVRGGVQPDQRVICEAPQTTPTPRSSSWSTRTASRSPLSGDIENLDTTSLASLTAGNVAATDGLAKLIGEKEFSVLFHEGEKDNIHISIVGERVILVVIFDERSLARPGAAAGQEGVGRAGRRLRPHHGERWRRRAPRPARLRVALRRDHGRRHRQPVQRIAQRPRR